MALHSGLSAAINDHLSKGALLINLSLQPCTLSRDVTSRPRNFDDDHVNHQYQQLAATRAKNTNQTTTKRFRSARAFASDSKINVTFHYCAEKADGWKTKKRSVMVTSSCCCDSVVGAPGVLFCFCSHNIRQTAVDLFVNQTENVFAAWRNKLSDFLVPASAKSSMLTRSQKLPVVQETMGAWCTFWMQDR